MPKARKVFFDFPQNFPQKRLDQAVLRQTSLERKKPYVIENKELFGLQRTTSEARLVAWGGIEPPTQGFSILCSTD